jgi:hypothetical protein
MPQNNDSLALVQTPAKKLVPLQGTPQGMVYAFPPGSGDSWFVNEATGSDSYAGTPVAPFATLDAAISAAVANNGDVVYLMGSSHRTTTLNWNKNGVSLVGLQSPSNNDRARISVQTVANGLTQTLFTALHPLVNVTAQGCSFINISAFFGGDGSLTPPTSAVCWNEGGGRNLYQGCQFFGFGDALTAVLAGARAFTISGNNGENKFLDCTFGGDTVVRSTAANATLEFVAGAGSPRNVFRNCSFEAWSTLSTNVQILVSSGGMDRSAWFQGCFMHNFGGTNMAVAVTNSGGSPAGNVYFQTPFGAIGATAIATSGNVYVDGNALGATTTGIPILAT